MSDNKPDSEQTSLTNRSVVAGTTVSSTDHEAWRNDIEARIDDLIAGLKDNSNHRAGASAPTDNTVEGQIYCDTTTDPATWKGDPDGSGADSEFHNASRWPSFHATLSGDQLNITSIDKIEFDTETFDTNSDFDKDTNFRFTPTVAGKYLLAASIGWLDATVNSNSRLFVYIYKNGAAYAQHEFRPLPSGSGFSAQNVTTIADANGSTDYFEVFAQESTANAGDVDSGVTTYFTGSRIA